MKTNAQITTTCWKLWRSNQAVAVVGAASQQRCGWGSEAAQVFLEEKLEKLLEAFQQSTHLFFDYAENSVHKLQA